MRSLTGAGVVLVIVIVMILVAMWMRIHNQRRQIATAMDIHCSINLEYPMSHHWQLLNQGPCARSWIAVHMTSSGVRGVILGGNP
ncbi:MAG: hypothetical protein ACO3K7_04815 [Candidatus Marinamargulisbacteria bacterium]